MEEINAKGGIQVGNKKMKIELVKADSNELFSIPDATNAMERLMTRDKADFVVGGFRTEAVLPRFSGDTSSEPVPGLIREPKTPLRTEPLRMALSKSVFSRPLFQRRMQPPAP